MLTKRLTSTEKGGLAPKLSERGLSRRTFIKAGAAAGGGLVISCTLPVLSRHAEAAAPGKPYGGPPNAYVRIAPDNSVTMIVPRVEMGQGTYTSLPMLIAEELEIDLNQVRLEHAPPDAKSYSDPLLGEQATGGSTAIRGAFDPLRRVGAVARTMLVAAAAQHWRVDAAACRGENGKGNPPTADIVRQLADASRKGGLVAEKQGDVDKALAGAAKRIEAVYEMPFLAHATMEPMNCTVHVRTDGCDVWVGTQVPVRAQVAAAQVTGLPQDKVQVHNQFLGGGFGRRLGVDGIAQAGAIGKPVDGPVKVIWVS